VQGQDCTTLRGRTRIVSGIHAIRLPRPDSVGIRNDKRGFIEFVAFVGFLEFVESIEFIELIEFIVFIECVMFAEFAMPPQVGVKNRRKGRD